jgi:hypothetical protein
MVQRPLLSWPHSSAPQQPHQQANQNSSAPRQEKRSFSHLAADLASSAVRNMTQAMHRKKLATTSELAVG